MTYKTVLEITTYTPNGPSTIRISSNKGVVFTSTGIQAKFPNGQFVYEPIHKPLLMRWLSTLQKYLRMRTEYVK